jgi:hypothetical protein
MVIKPSICCPKQKHSAEIAAFPMPSKTSNKPPELKLQLRSKLYPDAETECITDGQV